VREAVKAANIWHDPPLMRDLSPVAARKFYETIFAVCEQLKSARHLLTRRLSKTLINRRQFLWRQNRIIPRQLTPPVRIPNIPNKDPVPNKDAEDSSKYNNVCI